MCKYHDLQLYFYFAVYIAVAFLFAFTSWCVSGRTGAKLDHRDIKPCAEVFFLFEFLITVELSVLVITILHSLHSLRSLNFERMPK